MKTLSNLKHRRFELGGDRNLLSTPPMTLLGTASSILLAILVSGSPSDTTAQASVSTSSSGYQIKREQDDMDTLKQLNIKLGDAESKGEGEWLAGVIAPELAFRRADRTTIDNRAAFLRKVARSDPRETKVESIELYGDRAVVKCIVTTKSANGDKRFHNLRLGVGLTLIG